MSVRPVPREIVPWAAGLLGCKASELSLETVAGDASSRHYYRLSTGAATYVLAHAPPETEKNEEFASIGAILEEAGVRVPRIFSIDLKRGFMLLEDLGDQTLLPLLNERSVDAFYGDALLLLDDIASVEIAGRVSPRYDLALFREELSRFSEWFVEALLDKKILEQDWDLIHRFNQVLIDNALEQPQVLVHR
ncbi:MAG: phosphotransferase, partial [Halioglobus sp.]